MKAKKGCTPTIWVRRVTEAAKTAGLKPEVVLAGRKDQAHTEVRWNVWRELCDQGFSYYSIGKASGFDHTTVRFAHLVKRPPIAGNPVAQFNLPCVRAKMAREAA